MSLKTILITGGFGYVGSCLTPLLLAQGYRVKVIDLMLYGDYGFDALKENESFGEWSSRFELVRGDIRSCDYVRKAMDGVDAVIHLAAISNDPTGELDETLTRQVNFDAVGLLLNVAKESGVKRFINASSSSVFGIKNDPEVNELLEPEPLTAYSRYKALAEWLVVTASTVSFETVNIRPATICGVSPRQRFDLTVNKLTADAISKKLITVHGGQQRRPNVGMSDVINLYSKLLDLPADLINGRTFNFGFENHKVIDIAKIIQGELADLGVEIAVTDTHDYRDYHISSKKLLNELGYEPVSSIKDEVSRLRNALENGKYSDVDAPQYYNLKVMEMDRNADSYAYLSR